MTENIHSLLLGDPFVPNRRMTIKGEHFFADKNLFSNFYGISFFSSPEQLVDNPYISPFYSNLPGILDEYFDNGIPVVNPTELSPGKIAESITNNISEEFIVKPQKKSNNSIFKFSASFECRAEIDENGSFVYTYGTIMPNIICVTKTNYMTAILPFSPLSNLAFSKEKRTLQALNIPVSRELFLPPEEITVDFAINTKKLSAYFDSDGCGYIDINYNIEIGTSKCETSKISFEVIPLDP